MEAKRYHDCPICGRCESIQVGLVGGDDSYPDIVESECGCVITAEQADAILDPWLALDGLTVINELTDDPI